MTDSTPPSPPPLDALRAIASAFFERLATTLGDGERAAALKARIEDRQVALGARTAHLIANDLDRGNVGLSVFAAAAYEILATELPSGEAERLVDEGLNEPTRAWILPGISAWLDHTPDVFSAIRDASRDREAHYFGPSFAFVRPVDDDFGYVLNIPRCMFHEALVACGHPELQPILCRLDTGWIDAIDPAAHRMLFARPSTFATADVCRMWFMRLEDPSLGAAGKRRLPVAHAAPHR